MKIIAVDNYNNETKSDILIAENVHTCFGAYILDTLNSKNYSLFFKLVADDHKLYVWDPR